MLPAWQYVRTAKCQGNLFVLVSIPGCTSSPGSGHPDTTWLPSHVYTYALVMLEMPWQAGDASQSLLMAQQASPDCPQDASRPLSNT